jgi:hypothetical protein
MQTSSTTAPLVMNAPTQHDREQEALDERSISGAVCAVERDSTSGDVMSGPQRVFQVHCRQTGSIGANRPFRRLLPGCSSSVHNKEALPRLAVCKCLDAIHD